MERGGEARVEAWEVARYAEDTEVLDSGELARERKRKRARKVEMCSVWGDAQLLDKIYEVGPRFEQARQSRQLLGAVEIEAVEEVPTTLWRPSAAGERTGDEGRTINLSC